MAVASDCHQWVLVSSLSILVSTVVEVVEVMALDTVIHTLRHDMSVSNLQIYMSDTCSLTCFSWCKFCGSVLYCHGPVQSPNYLPAPRL